MMKHVAFIGAGIMAISAILLGTSCIDEYVQDAETQQTGILVIEGTITGDSLVTVYVNRTVRMDQTANAGLERNAEVRILCSDGTQSEAGTEVEEGEYAVPYHALDMSKSYCLQVKTGGKTYQSEFIQPIQTPPIDSLYWYKENTEAPVDIFVSAHDPEGKAQYYLWTYDEDWEIVPYYNTTYYAYFNGQKHIYIPYETNPNPYYYCWNRMRSQHILIEDATRYVENSIVGYPLQTFPCSDDRVCYLYCISVTQQALTEEAYRYYLNKRKLTEEMGTIFSPMPSELKGNISCLEDPEEDVVGFVHVTVPAFRRLFITREEVYLDNGDCRLFTIDQIKQMHPNVVSPLNAGFRFVYTGGGDSDPIWASVECVECTAKGTKEKPDFWPNDHE